MPHPAELLASAHAHGVATALQGAVVTREGVALSYGTGTVLPGGAAVDAATPFDLASLTKVTTAMTIGVLVDRHGLDLDTPVGAWLHDATFGGATIRQLLSHTAGLPAWAPWFEAARKHPDCAGLWPDGIGDTDRRQAVALVRRAALATYPRETGRVYSDLGFLALGWAIEAITGSYLDAAVDELLLQPLRLSGALRYHRLRGAPLPLAPATGVTRPRPPAEGQEGTYEAPDPTPRPDPGEVDDDNAWALGGVAGHAGLFGSAEAIATLGFALIEDAAGRGRLLRQETAALLVTADDVTPPRTMGLDVATPGGTAGALGDGPRGAVGHLGFTGTSLWLDLDRQAAVALCTNRTFPDRGHAAEVRALRVAWHDAVATWLDG